ncbi:uncharacterized protein YndB with AHSA1/START domain [Motilibacter peucedani]|uniref:Uncharacterized protein YndB with AHSA1/START domain n=1 Tax=Motilibacter peucedani TaxID=598650 RepID=A0A420XQQ1_9ACTN|nr:SRPBCC domain-containing protein [Motilibacter peucedani]RKS75532.1 uncharacterized protein YndB with AHSA1/START domain [Motilibacter peucedani]
MSTISLTRDYPAPPEDVWRVMTDPELIPLWTATGAGARADGFAPVVGTRFRFVAEPKPGWSGVVDCEVLEVEAPRLLRYSWTGGDGGATTVVTYLVEPAPGGARLTYHHTGFTGLGGLVMSRLLGRVRRRMLDVGVPAALDALAAGAR